MTFNAAPTPAPAKLRANAAHLKGAVLQAVADAVKALGLPLAGRTYIEQALKAPSRATGSARKNLSGRYPSERMGVVLQFESGTLELPALHELERDDAALMYCDQPPKIKLAYRTNGMSRGYLVTPDFLVVRRDRVVLVECKPLRVLQQRAEADPELYVRGASGWECPPAQRAAADLGFRHEVWADDRFPSARVANLRLLEDYLTGADSGEHALASQAAVEETLRDLGVATISELLGASAGRFGIDDIYRAIARRAVTCDLDLDSLNRHQTFRLFRDAETQGAFERSLNSIVRASDWVGPTSLELRSGTRVWWDGVLREVAHVGDKQVHLRGEDEELVSLDRRIVRQLLDRGAMREAEPADRVADARMRDAYEFIARSRTEDLRVANQRLDKITPTLAGVARPSTNRTLRRYVALYRQAEAAYGNGYLGLIPRFFACGNRIARLQQDALDIVAEKLSGYLDSRNIRIKRVHEEIDLTCQEKGLPTPSYAWLCRFVKSHYSPHALKLAREGSKAAYGLAPRDSEDPDAPATAEPVRPFERAHIDHTQIDVEAVFSDTGENLGRPWVTVMIDHHSRRILGFFLTYDSPSYRSVLMTLRDCVRRYGRLPSSIVVDGGREFRSQWFEVTCAFFKVTIVRRPPRKGRFGSQIERFFGSNNTMLLHNLRGNTQLRKNVRQMTPEVDPSKSAVWTLADLHDLLEEFFFELYDTLVHTGILTAPRAAFELGNAKHGERSERALAYDANFLIMTCPSTAKGRAKVQPDGVKINHFYYNAPGLNRYVGKSVEVRFEPFDLSVAFVHIDRQWVRVRSRFGDLLEGLGEHELQLVTAEYMKRGGDARRQRLNDTSLARFLRDVERKELLLAERRRALEQHRLIHRCASHWAQPAAKAPPQTPAQPHEQLIELAFEQARPQTEAATAEQPEAAVELMDMETY